MEREADDDFDDAYDRFVWNTDNGDQCPRCMDRYNVAADGRHWRCGACSWLWLGLTCEPVRAEPT